MANTASVGKLKVTVNNNVTDKELRLKANNNSGTFGIVTAGAQITLANGNIELSNYDDQRVTSTSSVTSLAEEIVSISNLAGEDLIIVSKWNSKSLLLLER